MISAVLLFLSAISVSNACVPTTTTTTTTPCCDMLSASVLARRPPSITTQQQCSVLQRVSSTCPVDGIVVCDAAPYTNPSAVLIQLFDGNTLVRSQSVNGLTVTVKVVCINGEWRVPISSGSATTAPITQVSCSQSGSVGTDKGYVVGSAF